MRQTRRVVLCTALAPGHPRLLLPQSSSPQVLESLSPRAVLPRSLSPGSIGASSSLGCDRSHGSTSPLFRNLYVLTFSYSPLVSMFTIWQAHSN